MSTETLPADTGPTPSGTGGTRTPPKRVEVPAVQPFGPLYHEPSCDAHRVVVVRGLLVEIALPQAHHATADEIDRRQQLERRGHSPLGSASVLARYYGSMLQSDPGTARRRPGPAERMTHDRG